MNRLKGTLVVMFHSNWCPYCRSFAPIFIEYARKSDFEYGQISLDNDDDPLWDKFHIEAVPTVIVFKEGMQIARRDSTLGGGLNRDDMESLIREVVTKVNVKP